MFHQASNDTPGEHIFPILSYRSRWWLNFKNIFNKNKSSCSKWTCFTVRWPGWMRSITGDQLREITKSNASMWWSAWSECLQEVRQETGILLWHTHTHAFRRSLIFHLKAPHRPSGPPWGRSSAHAVARMPCEYGWSRHQSHSRSAPGRNVDRVPDNDNQAWGWCSLED